MSSPKKLPIKGGTSPALWSPDGSMLAATSTQFGGGHAVVVPVAGGEAKRVATGSGVDYGTGWFADGERLAFEATTGEGGGSFTAFASTLATGAAGRLVPAEQRPLIAIPSPDGSHIAFNVIEGSRSTIWVQDSAGSSLRELTSEGFEDFTRMSWSPDGRSILYESRRTGRPDLWVVPVEGGKPRQLTRDVRSDRGGVWSPDSKWVAFLSDRGRQTDIWLVSANGGVEQRVTDTPVTESSLAWRPGTNELTFVKTLLTAGVWAMDVATGAERRLTPDSVKTNGFYGSPDGTQINYIINRGGGVQDLAVMPIAGGAPRTLVSGGGAVTGSLWSPNGKQIVFVSNQGGSPDVWIVDVAGGAPRQLTDWPGAETNAAWSGDGTRVYFQSDRDSKLGDVWAVSRAGGPPTRVTQNGTVGGGVFTREGVEDIFAGTINPNGGQLTISRVRTDGRVTQVWTRSNAGSPVISPSGDSIVALVEQPDGPVRSMIIPAAGGEGRGILGPNDAVSLWTRDGKTMVYTTLVDGVGDIALLNVADGTTRRLTNTPTNEYGAELTPDGKTMLMNRSSPVQGIFSVNLSGLLGRSK
jgi:Tol biopolymer transport system component